LKERYFTPESIEATAREILKVSAEAAPIHTVTLDMKAASLLILDMQRYFLDADSHAYIPSAGAVVPVIEKIAGVFRSNSRPVFLSRHVNTGGRSGMMEKWWGDLIDPDSRGSETIPALRGIADWEFEKSQYDAFMGTDLEKKLIGSSTRQVVVTGVMTHLCVESTARSAFMRGLSVLIPVDGTATYNAVFHRASMLNLSHGFASVVLSRKIIEAGTGYDDR
jgi:isochorismate hydrolase